MLIIRPLAYIFLTLILSSCASMGSGTNADAAAKAANRGASVEGEAYFGDVTVYTFTESGLALQATIKGTRFWKDKELN